MNRTRARSTAQRAGSRHYAHLSAFSVSLNQSVSRGQRIGSVGGTGFPNTGWVRFAPPLRAAFQLRRIGDGHLVRPSVCVKWGGSITGTTYTSPFEHCG